MARGVSPDPRWRGMALILPAAMALADQQGAAVVGLRLLDLFFYYEVIALTVRDWVIVYLLLVTTSPRTILSFEHGLWMCALGRTWRLPTELPRGNLQNCWSILIFSDGAN